MKNEFCQYYTRNAEYIMGDLLKYIPTGVTVIDPFAGAGDLLRLFPHHPTEGYDIEPQDKNSMQRDTLANPPDYNGKWVVTNPPFRNRFKCSNKAIFNQFNLDDLYKIAIQTLIDGSVEGGIVILPLNWLCGRSPKLRVDFLNRYRILELKIFEHPVFDQVSCTVCTFAFVRAENNKQTFSTRILPDDIEFQVQLQANSQYRMAAEFFKLIEDPNHLPLSRLLKDKPEVTPNSYLYLRTLDSGSKHGRIGLTLNKTPFFGRKSDRTCVSVVLPKEYAQLSESVQGDICNAFNNFLEIMREKYHSLFLSSYRGAKLSYARKRIGLDVAFKILSYILKRDFGNYAT